MPSQVIDSELPTPNIHIGNRPIGRSPPCFLSSTLQSRH
jgi:hypothetical protein